MDSNLCSDVMVREPYPPTEVSSQNTAYARILLSLYAGHLSELTAISQYIYQSIIIGQIHKDVSRIFECIAIVEMKHFKILGELIKKLGADPKLYAPINQRRFGWWSGEYPEYTNAPAAILNENIAGEKAAIAAYKNALNLINDPKIQDIIRRIIKDEEHHIEIFTAMKDEEHHK